MKTQEKILNNTAFLFFNASCCMHIVTFPYLWLAWSVRLDCLPLNICFNILEFQHKHTVNQIWPQTSLHKPFNLVLTMVLTRHGQTMDQKSFMWLVYVLNMACELVTTEKSS